jgi:AraC-like DNA-binding protein
MSPSFPRERLASDTGQIKLFACALMGITHSSWVARHVRDSFWRFYLNGSEGAALELPESEQGAPSVLRLGAGAVYLIPAGTLFSCSCAPEAGRVEHFYAHFDVPGWLPVAARVRWRPLLAGEPGSDFATRVAEFAHSLHGLGRLGSAHRCRLKALLWEALALAVEDLPAEARRRVESSGQGEVQPALGWIEEHLGEPMDVATLARLCHWSPDHFARRFRAEVGLSPAAYVTQRRVALASQKLLFESGSIEAIARECGFGNRFYFSRVFARHTGLAPAAYRKSRRI